MFAVSSPVRYFSEWDSDSINKLTNCSNICTTIYSPHAPWTVKSPWTNCLVEVKNWKLATHSKILHQINDNRVPVAKILTIEHSTIQPIQYRHAKTWCSILNHAFVDFHLFSFPQSFKITKPFSLWKPKFISYLDETTISGQQSMAFKSWDCYMTNIIL